LRHDLRLENGGETSAGCHNGEPLVSTPYFSRFYCLDSWVHYKPLQIPRQNRGDPHILLRCPRHQLRQAHIRQNAQTAPRHRRLTRQTHHRNTHPQRITGRRTPSPGERVQTNIYPPVRAEILANRHTTHKAQTPCIHPCPLQQVRHSLPVFPFPCVQHEPGLRHGPQKRAPGPKRSSRHLAEVVQTPEGYLPCRPRRQWPDFGGQVRGLVAPVGVLASTGRKLVLRHKASVLCSPLGLSEPRIRPRSSSQSSSHPGQVEVIPAEGVDVPAQQRGDLAQLFVVNPLSLDRLPLST